MANGGEKLSNPWKNLKLGVKPYVANELEQRLILEFNEGCKEKCKKKNCLNTNHVDLCKEKNCPNKNCIDLNLLPEPILGYPKSAVLVFLNLNPGLNLKLDFDFENIEDYRKDVVSLLNEDNGLDYPFYCLNPKYAGSGGYLWWNRILKHFLQDTKDKMSVKELSSKMACIEFFPYHSVSYKHMPKKLLKNQGIKKGVLPSQDYSIYLAKEAVERAVIDDCFVVLLRWRDWEKHIPNLKQRAENPESNIIKVNSPQNPSFHEKTVKQPEKYRRLLSFLNDNI